MGFGGEEDGGEGAGERGERGKGKGKGKGKGLEREGGDNGVR